MDKFGLQLYSIEKEIKERGFDDIFGMLAECGYNCVEFAGFFDYTPEQVVELCRKHALEPLSAHIGLHELDEQLPFVDALGIKTVVIPWLSKEALFDKFDETVEKIKKAQELLEARGVKLGYHNHAGEYEDGADKLYDLLNAVPGLIAEPDIFWVTVGGHDSVEMLKKYGDKVPVVHIKELDNAWKPGDSPRAYPSVVVGEGKSNCKGVIEQAKKMGIDHFVLEAEGTFPGGVESYLKKCCDKMKEYAKN